ncbi:MAG TPA: thioredoxin domain-containing protein [Allosphingosinicella sp.]|uniref:thioredoxin domain-containing protein n=1 Tax=Allosphingosinicella sp. TaxID=2823234 RepID=UPI002EDB46F8
MRMKLFFAAVAVTLAGPAAQLVAAPAKKAAAAKDWAQTVVATPEGGFRMGNPAAKAKVVEYASLTCPHCADFAKSGGPALKQLVKSGKVSFEYRSMPLNGIDVTATLVARCGGAGKFFPLADKLFATQKDWVGKISGLPQTEKDRLSALPMGERLGKLADVGGITQLAAQLGVAPAKAKQCLADPAGLDNLGKMHEAASALGVTGTPTFFINGLRVHAHDWAELEPLIQSAAG